MPMISRRAVLLGLSGVAIGGASLAFAAADTRKRLVAVILRGALDGLSVVVPYGDADLRRWRQPLVLPEPGQAAGLLDMGGFWGLHPELSQIHALYRAGDVLPVHAAAGPTRSRSHFEAQDLLECGSEQRMNSGWLNRLAAALPPAGENDRAVALGQNVPLLLRGPIPVNSWSPGGKASPGDEFYGRLQAMHAADGLTGPAVADGLREREFEAHAMTGQGSGAGGEAPFVVLARAAGRMLAEPAGPRLAALELDGWDTHANQVFRLGYALKPLDAGLAALRQALGPAWADTVVVVMTEFGRTVRVNGTGGTDHGTGSAAFVLGGNVKGGRVLADWPGLAENKLFENRDLAPTTDLRGVVKGLLIAQYALTPQALAAIFPASEGVSPSAGLLRS